MQHSKSFFNPKIFVWSPLFVLLLRLLFSARMYMYSIYNPLLSSDGREIASFRGAVNRGIGVLGILSVFISIGCGIYLSQQSGDESGSGGIKVKKKIQFSVFDILSLAIYILSFFLPALDGGNMDGFSGIQLGYETFLLGATTFFISIPRWSNVFYRISFFSRTKKAKLMLAGMSVLLGLATLVMFHDFIPLAGYYIWIGAFVIKLFAAFDPDGWQPQSKQSGEIEEQLDPVVLSQEEAIYIQYDTRDEKVDEKVEVQDIHQDHNFGKREIKETIGGDQTTPSSFLNKKSSGIIVLLLSMLGVFAIGTVLYQVLWVSHVDKKVQLEIASNTAMLAQQDMGQRQETKRRWDQTGIPYDKSALGVEEMSPQQKQKSLDVGIQDGMGDVVTDQAEIKEKAAENIQEKVDQDEVEQDSKSNILENIARMQLEQDSQDQDEEERQSDAAPLIDSIYTQSLGSSEYVLHAKIPTGAEKVVIQTKNEGLITFIDETYTLQKFDPSAGEFAYNIKPQYGNIAPGTNEYYIEVYWPDGSVSVYEEEIVADTGLEFDMDRERMMDLIYAEVSSTHAVSQSSYHPSHYYRGDRNKDGREDAIFFYSVENVTIRPGYQVTKQYVNIYLNIMGMKLERIRQDEGVVDGQRYFNKDSIQVYDVTGNGDNEVYIHKMMSGSGSCEKFYVLDFDTSTGQMYMLPIDKTSLGNLCNSQGIVRQGSMLVVTKKDYIGDDALCCPSGPTRRKYLHYQDGEYIQGKRVMTDSGKSQASIYYTLRDKPNMDGGAGIGDVVSFALEGVDVDNHKLVWDFGNYKSVACDASDCKNTSTVYNTAGRYTVSVQVQDPSGKYLYIVSRDDVVITDRSQ